MCNVSIAYRAVMQAAGTKWLTDYSGGQVGVSLVECPRLQLSNAEAEP